MCACIRGRDDTKGRAMEIECAAISWVLDQRRGGKFFFKQQTTRQKMRSMGQRNVWTMRALDDPNAMKSYNFLPAWVRRVLV